MAKKQNNVIPWDKIESEYIYGLATDDGNIVYPSVRELSKKYNVPFPNIGVRSKKGKWLQARESGRIDAANIIRDKAKSRQIQTMMDVCEQHILINRTIITMFLKGLRDGSIPLTAAVGFAAVKEQYKIYEDIFLGHTRGNQVAVHISNQAGYMPPIKDEERREFFTIGRNNGASGSLDVSDMAQQ